MKIAELEFGDPNFNPIIKRKALSSLSDTLTSRAITSTSHIDDKLHTDIDAEIVPTSNILGT